MKRTLLLLALCLSLPCAAYTQESGSTTSTATPPPKPPHEGPPGGWRGGGNLTDEEKQELKAAHDAAFQANPDLATKEKDLRDQMDALHKQIDEAMIKADPKVAPILAKLGTDRPRRGGPDGLPPPPKDKPASSDSAPASGN